ncbi:hypothetical protein Efla_004818 [Eimeria flavescens]
MLIGIRPARARVFAFFLASSPSLDEDDGKTPRAHGPMVCLPLSDTEAPLERLAGWRLVFFVILEFSLCVIFSALSPHDSHQPRPARGPPPNRQATGELPPLPLLLLRYRQPSWVQDLLPDLSGWPQEREKREWQPENELFNMLLEAEREKPSIQWPFRQSTRADC